MSQYAVDLYAPGTAHWSIRVSVVAYAHAQIIDSVSSKIRDADGDVSNEVEVAAGGLFSVDVEDHVADTPDRVAL